MAHVESLAAEKAHAGFELVGVAWLVGKDHDGPVDCGCEFRNGQRPAGANQSPPAGRLPGLRQFRRRADQE
jgi:hypothetical protein